MRLIELNNTCMNDNAIKPVNLNYDKLRDQLQPLVIPYKQGRISCAYRAEKRGWVNASEIIKIRELRKLIAHDYTNDKMPEIYAAVAKLSPVVLAVFHKVIEYVSDLASERSA